MNAKSVVLVILSNHVFHKERKERHLKCKIYPEIISLHINVEAENHGLVLCSKVKIVQD